jgi:hypothetical protein
MDKNLDEGRSRREKRLGEKRRGEAIKESSRILCHKNENESTYSRRKESRRDDISSYRQKKVENYASIQNSDISTKHDSKEDKAINSSSTQQSDVTSVQKKTVDFFHPGKVVHSYLLPS